MGSYAETYDYGVIMRETWIRVVWAADDLRFIPREFGADNNPSYIQDFTND